MSNFTIPTVEEELASIQKLLDSHKWGKTFHLEGSENNVPVEDIPVHRCIECHSYDLANSIEECTGVYQV